MIIDHLSARKGDRVKELIEERGCQLLYLPPYSPDFNPIEEAFAKIKALVRKAEARLGKLWLRPLAGGSPWSRPRTLAVSSTTVGTLRRFNYYDERCIRCMIALAITWPVVGSLRS